MKLNLKGRHLGFRGPTHGTVNKGLEFQDPIQDSFKLHPASLFRLMVVESLPSCQIGSRMRYCRTSSALGQTLSEFSLTAIVEQQAAKTLVSRSRSAERREGNLDSGVLAAYPLSGRQGNGSLMTSSLFRICSDGSSLPTNSSEEP